MTPRTEDESTVRLPHFPPPNRVAKAARWARRAGQKMEMTLLLFGAGATGALLLAIYWMLADERRTEVQKETVLWQTLALICVTGLSIGVNRGLHRKTDERIEALEVVAETQTQQGLTMLSAVAFSINDARIDVNKGLTKVYSLVADALERGGFASEGDVSALRDELRDMEDRVRQAARRMDELTEDFAQSQVARIHARATGPGRGRGSFLSGVPREDDHS